MDNYQVITNYVFPKNLVLNLINTYKELGHCDLIQANLKDFYPKFVARCVNEDTYEIVKYLKTEGFLQTIADTKIKQLIEKDITPHLTTEKMIVGIKKCLTKIQNESHRFLNEADLIDYLNLIFNNKVSFNSAKMIDYRLTKNDTTSSIRKIFSLSLENCEKVIKENQFDNIMAIMITCLDCYTLKPYIIDNIKDFDCNILASLILLYYLLNYLHINSFKLSSLFKLFNQYREQIKLKVMDATFNYYESYYKLNDLTMYFLDLINISINDNLKIDSEHADSIDLSKLNAVEKSIIFINQTFTKDDVRNVNPYASDSTIVRALKEMIDNKLIIPLSKGRNATYLKIGTEEEFLKYMR